MRNKLVAYRKLAIKKRIASKRPSIKTTAIANLESDLISCENALLNYPERAKQIKPLINYLNKKIKKKKVKIIKKVIIYKK